MAITLSQRPDTIAPVYSNRNKFIMSEVGATYFTLVFSGDVSGTFKIFPNTLGIAEFDARYFLRDCIYSQIALPSQPVLPNALKTYSVEITSSLSTILNVSGLQFFNGALQDREDNNATEGFILNNIYGININSPLDNLVDFQGNNLVDFNGNNLIKSQ